MATRKQQQASEKQRQAAAEQAEPKAWEQELTSPDGQRTWKPESPTEATNLRARGWHVPKDEEPQSEPGGNDDNGDKSDK